MSDQIVLHAKKREEQGKGASRRLRKQGQVPTIIYGAGKEPKMISLDHNKLLRYEMDESFFSSILKVEIDGGDEENVIIRDYQRDPVKPFVLHVDLLRIKMSEKMHTTTPLHFVGDEEAAGIKAGGILQRLITEVDILCMPADLPEAIEVDVSALDIGDSLHLSQIVMPEGVELAAMIQMDEADEEDKATMDLGIVSIQAPRAEVEEIDEEAAGAEGDDSAADSDSSDDAADGDKAALSFCNKSLIMANTPIKLIVGLGNPGAKYTKTRHNAGFWFVDALANDANESFRIETKFSAEVCKINLGGNPVWLQKPTTFMNRSGMAVKQLSSFYKIPVASILIVHDEIDLPPGTVRLKEGGGHGGHNGLRDIHAHMTKEYIRLRIGVGHPGDRNKVVDYVLSHINTGDEIEIKNSIDAALGVIDLVVAGDMQKAMNNLHSL